MSSVIHIPMLWLHDASRTPYQRIRRSFLTARAWHMVLLSHVWESFAPPGLKCASDRYPHP
eukprot:8080294-Pyramimonas_sp.AAC.1